MQAIAAPHRVQYAAQDVSEELAPAAHVSFKVAAATVLVDGVVAVVVLLQYADQKDAAAHVHVAADQKLLAA